MFLKARQARARNGTGTALVPAAPAAGPTPPRGSAPSIIAADLHIVGNVTTEGLLHVDGRVDGDVHAYGIVVGDSGHIVGHVHAEDISVQGIVSGSVRARRVHLVAGCKVIADITHGSLVIDDGASFEGQCRRQADGEDEMDLGFATHAG